jgi:hypothetical protein
MEAQDKAEEQQKQSSSDMETLMKEKQKLETELSVAAEQARTIEKQYQMERAETSLRESEEQEKIRLLMERLESSSTSLEKKQQALDLEKKAIAEQREEIREQFENMRRTEEEFQQRLGNLKEKVS